MQFTARFLTLFWIGVWAADARGDKLVIRERNGERRVEGNILKTDSSGATLFETRDGQHLVVPKDRLVRSEKSEKPVPLWTRAELKTALAEEFGKDFKVTESNGYVIVHSCSTENAKEAGRLLNKAQNAFVTYFTKNGFHLQKSKQPLIAVVFEGREQYDRYVGKYLGDIARMTVGVYIPPVNRIFLYNAFGGETAHKVGLATDVNPTYGRQLAGQILEQNISTLVHEAVHQAAYNTGFHNRKVVDYPLWLVEGMAMYFETTDVNAPQGWKGGKSVNRERALRFKTVYQRGLSPGFLERLIVDDGYLRTQSTAQDGYALAWTFTYYLLRHHKAEYMEYVRLINSRPEFAAYPRSARLKDFETAFKMPPSEMETAFANAAAKLIER